MRKLLLSLLGSFIVACVIAQDHPMIPASTKTVATLTAADWQNDLRFLQQTVHKDYSFLFKKITATEFDAEVEKLYKAMPGMSDNQRIAGLARVVSLFKYGHTNIGWRQMPFKYHVAPVNFYWFSDGLYAEGAHKDHAAIVGAKLVKVEGMLVKDVLEAIKPLVPAENEQYFKAYGLDFIAIPEALHAQGVTKELKTAITYTFEKNGKTFDYTVKAIENFHLPRNYGFSKAGDDWISAREQNTIPDYLKNIDKNYSYEYLPASKTVYVRQSQVLDDKDETIAAFYKKVFEFVEKNEVEKLVIDVRLNGGGNNYKNKPVVMGLIECKKINQTGKLFVITGKRTFSACQNLVNEFSNYTNAIFVGEPTAENVNFYGDTRRVELPKTGIPVFLSFAWWQDKPQWENADWLAPHLAVEMSFEDYKTNKDPVLETCLNFNDKDYVLDPMTRLRDLFTAGKLDEVEAEAKRMVADPKYRYLNFESKINDAGYNMLNSKQTEAALMVFGLNTKLFPRSANAWDSYAEANWKAGKTDKAIEYYNKAIELDPGGATGDNARNMLKEIKATKGFEP
ncbi:MAG TPA: tetratricopeptide repeat protein [Chitinophagaceae bacterium]|nr:tetratricopeptide repeat protein [Chitinophagaceae bacterium]